jgi:hypothetical protein
MMEYPICRPFDCDDPDRHLGVPPEYTPLKNRGCHCGNHLGVPGYIKNRGCHCGADIDGRDCMCFEDN